jgi:hypothetical protein
MPTDDAPSDTLPGITRGDHRRHQELSDKMRDGTITREELEQLVTVVAKEKAAAAQLRDGRAMYLSMYASLEETIATFRRSRGW